jgi:exosortase H (IPTLxxWG-CTERM-specific)
MANPTSANPTDGSIGAQPPHKSRARMRQFAITFPILLVAGFGLLLAPFSRPAINVFTSGLVAVSARLVSLCGGKIAGAGDVLRNPVTGYSIRVEDACNGSNVTILLWAAILAFPASWPQKLKGLFFCTLLLHAVNLVRIISLFYIGQLDHDWFEFAHLYAWESLIVLITLVIFWNWVQRSYRAEPV